MVSHPYEAHLDTTCHPGGLLQSLHSGRLHMLDPMGQHPRAMVGAGGHRVPLRGVAARTGPSGLRCQVDFAVRALGGASDEVADEPLALETPLGSLWGALGSKGLSSLGQRTTARTNNHKGEPKTTRRRGRARYRGCGVCRRQAVQGTPLSPFSPWVNLWMVFGPCLALAGLAPRQASCMGVLLHLWLVLCHRAVLETLSQLALYKYFYDHIDEFTVCSSRPPILCR